jgi:hypothetical protein
VPGQDSAESVGALIADEYALLFEMSRDRVAPIERRSPPFCSSLTEICTPALTEACVNPGHLAGTADAPDP